MYNFKSVFLISSAEKQNGGQSRIIVPCSSFRFYQDINFPETGYALILARGPFYSEISESTFILEIRVTSENKKTVKLLSCLNRCVNVKRKASEALETYLVSRFNRSAFERRPLRPTFCHIRSNVMTSVGYYSKICEHQNYLKIDKSAGVCWWWPE